MNETQTKIKEKFEEEIIFLKEMRTVWNIQL